MLSICQESGGRTGLTTILLDSATHSSLHRTALRTPLAWVSHATPPLQSIPPTPGTTESRYRSFALFLNTDRSACLCTPCSYLGTSLELLSFVSAARLTCSSSLHSSRMTFLTGQAKWHLLTRHTFVLLTAPHPPERTVPSLTFPTAHIPVLPARWVTALHSRSFPRVLEPDICAPWEQPAVTDRLRDREGPFV